MRKKVLEITLVCLLFLLLAIIDTYPLVRYLDKGMPYFPYPDKGHEVTFMAHGDYLQLYYNLWLFKDAISGNIPFFTNPYEFSVGEGYMPSFNQQFLPMSFFFAVLSVFGDITAYNILVILSYILTGLSGYLLVKLYTRSWFSGLFAGILLALFPYRTGELLGGHPNGFLLFLIPLTIYLLERSFRDGNILASIGAGLSVISMSLLEGHFHFYTFLFLSFFIPWRLFFPLHNPVCRTGRREVPQINLIDDIRKKDVIFVFFSGLVTGFSIILVKSSQAVLEDPIFYSSLLFPFLLIGFWILYARLFGLAANIPFRQSLKDDAPTYLPLILFLFYPIRLIYPIEHLGKGIAALALCGVIVLKGYRIFRLRGQFRERFLGALPDLKPRLFKTILPFFLMASLTIIWALYTRSHLEVSIASEGRPLSQVMRYSPEIGDIFERHNKTVEKNIYLGMAPFFLGVLAIFLRKIEGRRNILFFGAVFIVTLILSFGPNLEPYIHLYTILYNHIPFFNYPRVAGRMITMTVVALAVLSGYGMREIERRMRPAILSVLIPLLVIIDYIPFNVRGISLLDRGNSVYEVIKRDPESRSILEIPFWPGDSAWSSIYQYYVTIYRYRMANGYDPGVSRKYIEDIFKPLYPINFGEIDERMYLKMKELGIKYLTFHEEVFPTKVSPFPPDLSLLRLKDSPYIQYVKRDGPIHLFRVLDVDNEEIKTYKARFRSSPIGKLYEAELSPHNTGIIISDQDASGGYALLARPGDRRDFLLFGPYAGYPSGQYRALFRLKVGDRAGSNRVAVIDISTDEGRTQIVKQVVSTSMFKDSNKYQDFILFFSIDSVKQLEFRVFYEGNADLYVDYVYVTFADQKDPAWMFEARDLFHTPDSLISDTDAISGMAVYGKPERLPRDWLLYGPMRRYEKGAYTASFRLKVKEKIGLPVATLKVIDEGNGEVITQRMVKGQDFLIMAGEYMEFPVDFVLSRPAIMKFLVFFEDNTEVWVDRIKVKEKDQRS